MNLPDLIVRDQWTRTLPVPELERLRRGREAIPTGRARVRLANPVDPRPVVIESPNVIARRSPRTELVDDLLGPL
jgi:hypothetical protein